MDTPLNYVMSLENDKTVLILPPDWDYSLVEMITEGLCEWDYSISFKGAWGIGGIWSEGEKFFVDHYDFKEMRRIATAWDLRGHTYSILNCANPNFMDRVFYKFLYLMGEGDYSGSGPIHLTRVEKQQLADGWGISLEELVRQLPLLKIVPRETPSCSITHFEEWSFDIDFSVPPVSKEEKIAKIGEIISFHSKEVNRLRAEYFNSLHTPEERQYYREVWGFDPASDRIYKNTGEDCGNGHY